MTLEEAQEKIAELEKQVSDNNFYKSLYQQTQKKVDRLKEALSMIESTVKLIK